MRFECACAVLFTVVATVVAQTGAPPFAGGVGETEEPWTTVETTGNPNAPMKWNPAWKPQNQQVDQEEPEDQADVESEVEEVDSEVDSEVESEVEEYDAPDAPDAQNLPDAADPNQNQVGNQGAGAGLSSDELSPAAFMKIGGRPFHGMTQADIDKAAKAGKQAIGRTVGIILGSLFIIAAAAAVAIVVIRKRSA
ncbi:uncharacterized protein [Amphiura filiformis]|uniref:uncharacterized protein n=1 Tax=Amphiura filiformis TaxID=82378 RepID=UPI003B2135EE